MRSLVYLLVLGNVIVFSMSAGWVGGHEEAAASSADESHQPLSPDRIKIVSRGAPPPISAPSLLCLEWHDLSSAHAGELEKVLIDKSAGGQLSVVREETQAAVEKFWVYIPPPAGGKAGSEKKVAELKKLGVKEFQLVQEGSANRWSISFGMFDTEAAAGDLLAELKKVGVRSAKSGVFSQTPARHRLRASGPDAAFAAARKLQGLDSPSVCAPEQPAAAEAEKTFAPMATDGAVPPAANGGAAPARP